MDELDKKPTKKEIFLKMFEISGCNITLACKKANIVRQTYYNWIDKDPDFADAVDNAREGLLDLAESILIKNIKEGGTTELIFFLKTKGKKRGYVERTEHKIDKEIEIDFTD